MHFAFCISLFADDSTALFHSLDPTSVTQHLAFYELHKDSKLGQEALKDAAQLLGTTEEELQPLAQDFLSLTFPNPPPLSDEALQRIEKLGKDLPNRRKRGYSITTFQELLALPSEEIDTAHALLLLEGNGKRTYEAMLDVLALLVKARLPEITSAEEKIQAINQLLFFDLGIRFPPHSLSEKAIDTYTFLPAVLDSRRGVCLGVSTLYLALGERLDLPLEIITPPGHIYVASGAINIETTARGVHIPSDYYLGINNKALRVRKKKEVLGMTLMNQGSKYLSDFDAKKAEACYEKALLFMPDDPYLKTFYACSLLLQGKSAKKDLDSIQEDPTTLSPDLLQIDLRTKKISKESLQALFILSDHTRRTQETKRIELEKAVQRDPSFQSALMQLAGCYIELKKYDLALVTLEKVSKNQSDITCEYLLAALYHERYNNKKAREHFEKAKEIAKQHGYVPEPLEELERVLY